MKPYLLAASIALLPISAFADPSATQVVKGFIDAYNQHSVEQMLTHVSDDVRWMHISGSKIEVETSDKAQFGAAMTDYFETLTGAQATILEQIVSSHYVSTVERVTWENDGEQLSQCSIGNFRVQDGKIAEFWYLPAHACDEQFEVTEQVEPESEAEPVLEPNQPSQQ
ncbi:nuclear transport factor 2 family protein [Shewanella insulae]|uniref:Nuclear transport factor 2 family protein n=1 Tax=Shewanella insulae TaxID=2681496 RepID=A0A6L7I2P8_9GAMM|nr:nuclear transport factor 2 family protein [Shewanella insulae]MCG9754422.1 nuclear transport factor 2 family protein [Shewanella insulae]MXR70837.1 nuclear transport factor 2 family protein [Shewanella insulae]